MGLWDDDEEVSAARSGFVKIEDLFKVPAKEIAANSPGRLLVIKPVGSGTRESKIAGQGDYTYVECDVAVLDGPTTEMITELPMILESFQMSGASLTGLLLPKLRTGKSVLGRMGAHRAQRFNTVGWHLDEPTEADWETYAKFKAHMKGKAAEKERAALSQDVTYGATPAGATPVPAAAAAADNRAPWE